MEKQFTKMTLQKLTSCACNFQYGIHETVYPSTSNMYWNFEIRKYLSVFSKINLDNLK
jgi:hypothetical protein